MFIAFSYQKTWETELQWAYWRVWAMTENASLLGRYTMPTNKLLPTFRRRVVQSKFGLSSSSCFSETLLTIHRSEQRDIPQHLNQYQHRCENMKPIKSIILRHVPCIFYYFVLWPTIVQLFHRLTHSYMFRHYRVILREHVINTLPI
jgi:hypothetical protein